MSAEQGCPVVYVAEDNPILLQGLRRALTTNGYTVRTAPDGGAMLRMLESEAGQPDLLLLDVMMPEISGVELLRTLRADRRWVRLPVVLITAATDSVPADLVDDAAVEMLAKPFRLSELLESVARHAGGPPAVDPET